MPTWPSQGDRIAAIGQLAGAEARTVIDADGNIVAPGFIDVHTHSDAALLSNPHLVSKTTQGFTTEFLMLDGISYAPVEPPHGPPLDPVSAAPRRPALQRLHGLGNDRASTWPCWTAGPPRTSPPSSPTPMCGRWRAASANATPTTTRSSISRTWFGRGCVRAPAACPRGWTTVDECFATTEELVRASLALRESQGVYVTHVRYPRGTLEGVREAVEIGRKAGVPVHISHLKGATEAEVEDLMDYIDLVAINEVDFSFDVYPYKSSSTMLHYLLPPEVWTDGVLAAYSKLADPALRDRFQRRLETESLEMLTLAWVPGRANSRFLGSTLAAIRGRQRPPRRGCALRPAASRKRWRCCWSSAARRTGWRASSWPTRAT